MMMMMMVGLIQNLNRHRKASPLKVNFPKHLRILARTTRIPMRTRKGRQDDHPANDNLKTGGIAARTRDTRGVIHIASQLETMTMMVVIQVLNALNLVGEWYQRLQVKKGVRTSRDASTGEAMH